MATTGGVRGLHFTAGLNIQDAKKNALELKKILADLKIASEAATASPAGKAKAFDVKPLTEYQAGILKIKQEALELAKQKQEQQAADRAASLALQAALRAEATIKREAAAADKLAKQELLALQKQATAEASKRKPTQISNSQAEIDAYKKSSQGIITNTSAINAQVAAQTKANAMAANQAVATGNNTNATNQQTAATNQNVLSKKQLAQMLAEEKYRQAQATAELKNNSREMLNAKGSLEQRRAALIRLTTVWDRLNKAERESASGKRMEGIIRGLVSQISILEEKTGRAQRSVGGYAEGISSFFKNIGANILSVLAPMALLTAAIATAKEFFQHNVEISDNFVDVQRTAKLTADEVDNLGKQLKGINTRTSLDGLLDIGFIAGKLGVAKEDIIGFTKEVDQLSVVLKKELPGGAEVVAESLGRIVKIYKLTENEGISLGDAMRKVGSGLLDLAHSGPITVKYLQDFTLGVAGTAVSARLSLPQIAAYGAVMQTAGTIASSASISLTRLVNDLSTKRAKYFAIAQLEDSTLTVEKFNNLINTDTQAALALFFKGLKAGNPTQIEFNDRIKSVGITTGKVSNAVKVLANNYDLLGEKTAIISKGYEEGTSVAHNFELANNSLAASFDKIKNSVVNFFTSSENGRALAGLLNAVTDNRTESEKLSDAYNDNSHAAHELNNTLNPLISKYDELKSKGKLNREEQTELKDVIQKIGEIMPEVISKYGDYNNALDINRDKITALTKAQKELLELQNREALKSANKEFSDNISYLPTARAVAQDVAKEQRGLLDKLSDLTGGDVRKQRIQDAKDIVTEVSKNAYEAAKRVKELGGVLNKAQKDIIAYYEGVANAKRPKKQQAEILGTGELVDETEVGRTTEVIKAEIKALQDADKKLAITSNEFKANVSKIKELRKELRIALGGKDTEAISAENKYQTAVKARNDLQGQIDALTKRGVDKQLSADEQEVESVKAKYKKLRDEANKFNNSKTRNGLKVNTSGLDRAQSNETDAILAKQAVESLKVQLEGSKKLYEDYEFFKTKLGKEKADEKYSAQLKSDESYLEKLKRMEEEILNPQQPKGADSGGELSAIDKARLKAIQEERKVAQAAQDKSDAESYQKAAEAAMGHANELLRIEKEYQANIEALRKNGGITAEQQAILDKAKAKAISESTVTELMDSDVWVKLFSNLDELGSKEIGTLISEIEANFANLAKNISPVDINAIRNKLNEARNILLKENPFKLVGESIAKIFDNSADSAKDSTKSIKTDWKQLGESTAASFQFVTDAIGSAEFLKEAIGEVGSTAIASLSTVAAVSISVAAAIKTAEKASVILAIVQAALVVVQAVASVLGSVFAAHDKKIEKSIGKHKDAVEQLSRAYNQLERDIKNSVGKAIEAAQKQQLVNLKAQQDELEKAKQDELRKKKADQAKIDEYNEQIANLGQTAIDVQNAINEAITGTTASSITDAIIQGFKDGKRGMADFADTFKEYMSDALYRALQVNYLDDAVQGFYKRFTSASEGGLTAGEITTLQDDWAAIIEAGGKMADDIDKVTGGIASPTSDNSLQGAYSTASQESITLLAGQTAGMRLAQLETNNLLRPVSQSVASLYLIAKDNFTLMVQIEKNTGMTAANTLPIGEIRDGINALNKKVDANSNALKAAGL